MYTLGRRSRMHSLLAAASLAACASQSSTLARQPAPVDLNAPGEWARYARMADLLAARVPALDIRQIGNGRFTMRVRGHTTLPDAEPVVVIDGARYLKNGAEMLASIAPREVKRIEVLKDAASVAGYASAAAGGVVVVTTWRH